MGGNTMVDEVVVINYEKMICNIMKREGGANLINL